MTEEQQHDIDVARPRDRIDIFLDGAAGAVAEHDSALEFRTGYFAAWRTDLTSCGSRPTTPSG